MRPDRLRLERLADCSPQMKGNSFYLELARFDLGEIQNIVDHLQQCLGRGFDNA